MRTRCKNRGGMEGLMAAPDLNHHARFIQSQDDAVTRVTDGLHELTCC